MLGEVWAEREGSLRVVQRTSTATLKTPLSRLLPSNHIASPHLHRPDGLWEGRKAAERTPTESTAVIQRPRRARARDPANPSTSDLPRPVWRHLASPSEPDCSGRPTLGERARTRAGPAPWPVPSARDSAQPFVQPRLRHQYIEHLGSYKQREGCESSEMERSRGRVWGVVEGSRWG